MNFGKRVIYMINSGSGNLFDKIGFIVCYFISDSDWENKDGGDCFIIKVGKDGNVEVWIV